MQAGPSPRVPWTEWVTKQCQTSRPANQTVMVPVHRSQAVIDFIFNFGVETELLLWKLEFLAWALSDNFNKSSVEIGFDLSKGNNTVSLRGGLRFELQDCASS